MLTLVSVIQTLPWPRFSPSIYPLLKNLPWVITIWVGMIHRRGLNFKPNLFAFRLEIRPKFCVANFRNPIFSFFLLKFLYNISFESNFCMVYQVDLIRANKHKIEITKGVLKGRTSHSKDIPLAIFLSPQSCPNSFIKQKDISFISENNY